MSTVTVVPTVEANNVPPRVRLDITDTGTAPAITSTTVTRLDPDGRTVPVRTDDGNPLTLTTSGSNRVGLIYDTEVPYGAAVSYSTLESPTVVSAEVTVPETRVWLIHPGVPALSMPITVATFGNRVRRAARGVFYPMGRTSPVVQTDGSRKSPEGTIELKVDSLTELAALDALTADAGVVLLNVPAGLGWGVPTSYISVGDIEEVRLVNYAADPHRYYVLPYIVVDRPSGGSQSQRTFVDLMDFATLASIQSAYPTLAAVLAGP